MTAYCMDCKFFAAWMANDMPFDHDAEGVCTAPRPQIGPPPNREVKQLHGKNCKMLVKGGEG